jgi:hypothetical protein
MAYTQKRNTVYFEQWETIKTDLNDFELDVAIKESDKGKSVFGNVKLMPLTTGGKGFEFFIPLPQELELLTDNLGTDAKPKVFWDISNFDATESAVYDQWCNQISPIYDMIRLKYGKFTTENEHFKDWSVDIVDLKKKTKRFEFSLKGPAEWKLSHLEDLNGLKVGNAMTSMKCVWAIQQPEKKKLLIGVCFELLKTPWTKPVKKGTKRSSDDISGTAADLEAKVAKSED